MGLGEILKELKSVGHETWQLTNDALASSLLDVCSVIHDLEALRFRMVSDIEDRGAVPFGYTGPAAWLASTTALNNREASRSNALQLPCAATPTSAPHTKPRRSPQIMLR
ncbi:hypothetical protein [Antrihabitans cavernicola]|uniref:DUF222 domain-containing protein n=1 Tax=Antrihabitans cavernicola TaxID=2495913 RepID=A0A5A7SDA7_9NOCA|nr:hypothetical protein [Spelaeibacter cavernicola]KAA0022717.1 hypothetical protein FOY51_13645 [Spelaeibacter cavernicola]